MIITIYGFDRDKKRKSSRGAIEKSYFPNSHFHLRLLKKSFFYVFLFFFFKLPKSYFELSDLVCAYIHEDSDIMR